MGWKEAGASDCLALPLFVFPLSTRCSLSKHRANTANLASFRHEPRSVNALKGRAGRLSRRPIEFRFVTS